LSIEAILEAAKRSGAEAIHPGYGFLAENSEFAQKAVRAGLIFVGPSPGVIAQMGSKVTARSLCAEANIPTIPGSQALDDQGLVKWAGDHGFPVMLKASAGGGGKGMRRISNLEDLERALPSARREAQKAFGSDELFLEKALVQARHLEVQIVGDSHGHHLHLGVRECSLQRRQQKIIEECPPPNVSSQLLQDLTDAALRLARSVGYSSLGTVEFLIENDDFYFLEMNTRLQVEHPVTEMVTGLDLVELQLKIAEGSALGMTQDEILFRGHAVEARIACEDPYNNFMPATGVVLDWKTCSEVRYDSCLEIGSVITPYYDSMVAKVIAHSQSREKPLRRLEDSLRKTVLLGVRSNIDFLGLLLRHPSVTSGQQHTELVESVSLESPSVSTEALLAAAAARWLSLTGGQTGSLCSLPIQFDFQNQPPVTVSGSRYSIADRNFRIEIVRGALIIDGHRLPVAVANSGEDWWIHTQQGTTSLKSLPRLASFQAQSQSDGTLKAPMPGTIVEVLVKEGDRVTEAQPLLKMEAMKMEQALCAPRNGTVSNLSVQVGDQVASGVTLLVVSAAEL